MSKGIVLIGMAGVGKSAIGKSLSKILGFAFIDLDEYMVEKNGKSNQEIVDERGEKAFLELERQRMYEIDLNCKVVAPGGSIIYHPDLMQYLKQHSILIHLDDSFKDIESRIIDASSRAIIGLKTKSLREIYNERRSLYFKYAHFTIDCQGKTENQVIEEIQHFLVSKNIDNDMH